ncbi:MAG: hypothetical protein WBR18_05370 [Anaerolineales bacterium]
MADIRISLPDKRLKELQSMSEQLGVSTEVLARLGVEDMLSGPDDQVKEHIDRLLEKNRELYRRLAG